MNQEYITKLLLLCTDDQVNLFNRMYPNGPNDLNVAIDQIERTLRDNNIKASKLLKLNVELEEQIKMLTLKL